MWFSCWSAEAEREPTGRVSDKHATHDAADDRHQPRGSIVPMGAHYSRQQAQPTRVLWPHTTTTNAHVADRAIETPGPALMLHQLESPSTSPFHRRSPPPSHAFVSQPQMQPQPLSRDNPARNHDTARSSVRKTDAAFAFNPASATYDLLSPMPIAVPHDGGLYPPDIGQPSSFDRSPSSHESPSSSRTAHKLTPPRRHARHDYDADTEPILLNPWGTTLSARRHDRRPSSSSNEGPPRSPLKLNDPAGSETPQSSPRAIESARVNERTVVDEDASLPAISPSPTSSSRRRSSVSSIATYPPLSTHTTPASSAPSSPSRDSLTTIPTAPAADSSVPSPRSRGRVVAGSYIPPSSGLVTFKPAPLHALLEFEEGLVPRKSLEQVTHAPSTSHDEAKHSDAPVNAPPPHPIEAADAAPVVAVAEAPPSPAAALHSPRSRAVSSEEEEERSASLSPSSSTEASSEQPVQPAAEPPAEPPASESSPPPTAAADPPTVSTAAEASLPSPVDSLASHRDAEEASREDSFALPSVDSADEA